jgi:hypothetical protein
LCQALSAISHLRKERQPLIAAIDGHKKVPLRVGKLLTLIAALEKAA